VNRNGRTQAGALPGSADRVQPKRKGIPPISRPIAIAAVGLFVVAASLFLVRSWMPQSEVVALAPDTGAALDAGGAAAPESGQAEALGLPAGPDSLTPPATAPQETLTATAEPPAGTGQQGAASPIGPEQVARAADPRPAPTTPVAPPTALNPAVVPGPQGLLERRANAGDVKAALLLGLRFADGDGVPANDSEAIRWLQRAAQAGEPVAQYRLGTLYERGRGVTADAKQATTWYLESAKRGNRKAMHNLAVAYADGAGIEKNFNLAVLYERGLGVPASLGEAYKWYGIAAAQGDAESKMRIEALATQLQPAQRDTADVAVKAFKAQAADSAANDPPALAQVVQ
jgi:localization factor PodJL